MAKFRCPRCGAIFEGKTDRCPRCNVLFKFNKEDENAPEYAIAERKEEKEEDVAQEQEPKAEVKEVVVVKEVPVVVEKPIIPEANEENTYFDGKMIQRLGWSLLGALVSLVTLGICFPIAYCWLESWRLKHTVINGYRHRLTVGGGKLIGRWILWELLTIVTLGIFGLWVPVKVEKWVVARTVLEFDQPKEEKKEEAPQEEPKQIEEKK